MNVPTGQALRPAMLVHILSFDIVAGILGAGVLAEHALAVSLPWAWWICVPGAAWVVYTADRLLDAARVSEAYPTLRHRFHRQHRHLLTVAVAVVAGATLVAACWLPWWCWLVAAGAGTLVVAHHAAQRRAGSPWLGAVKDLNVTLTYTAAVWAVPVVLAPATPTLFFVITAVVAITAAIVIEESVADIDVDTALDQPSIARSLGERASRFAARSAVTVSAAATLPVAAHDAATGAVLMAMTLSAGALGYVFRRRWPRPYQRLVAELTLALPLLLLAAPPPPARTSAAHGPGPARGVSGHTAPKDRVAGPPPPTADLPGSASASPGRTSAESP